MAENVEAAICELLEAKVAQGKSVSPEEVARAVDPEGWRRLLGQVRAIARGLARQGKVIILRHNKPADPGDFKGVYRIRLPMAGDPTPPEPQHEPQKEETP
jgi:hypothetical protein